jgi:hypothetical protein
MMGMLQHQLEAGRLQRHDDLAGAAVRLWVVRVGDGHDDGEGGALRGGGEPFVAVDHIVGAVLDCGGAQPDRVGAGVFRLGHGEATADRAGGQGRSQRSCCSALPWPWSTSMLPMSGAAQLKAKVAQRRAAQLLADAGKGAQRQAEAAIVRRHVRGKETVRADLRAHGFQRRQHRVETSGQQGRLQWDNVFMDNRADLFDQFWFFHSRLPSLYDDSTPC